MPTQVCFTDQIDLSGTNPLLDLVFETDGMILGSRNSEVNAFPPSCILGCDLNPLKGRAGHNHPGDSISIHPSTFALRPYIYRYLGMNLEINSLRSLNKYSPELRKTKTQSRYYNHTRN